MARSIFRWGALVCLGILWTAGPAGAAHPDPSGARTLAPWGHVGPQVHRSSVQGYQLSYHLLSYAEDSEVLARLGRGRENAHAGPTHHLMVFVMGPDGKMRTGATVALRLRGPGGDTGEVRAAPMAGGYGADVDLAGPGPYTVEATVVDRGVTLRDAFPLPGR